jgi:hypothetical protein
MQLFITYIFKIQEDVIKWDVRFAVEHLFFQNKSNEFMRAFIST